MSIRLSPSVRISASLVSLTITVLLAAAFMGLVPERESAILQGRKQLCQTMAIHCSVAAQRNDLSTITEAMQAFVRCDPAIQSAAVRDVNGNLLVEAGDHESHWGDWTAEQSTPTHVHAPIALGDERWGSVELRFQPLASTDITAWLANPLLRLSTFVVPAGFAAYFVYLRRLLASQPPGPLHEVFAKTIEQSPAESQACKVSKPPWTPQAIEACVDYTRARAHRESTSQMGSAEIRRQNLELKTLASSDPLTSCLNRRSFFAEFETQWGNALRYEHPLSCVMVDVDHFKAINDRHGHRVGDQVLQQVAERLKAAVRQGDLVCRYGGEEFCILLPHTDLTEAAEAAERFCQEIASQTYSQVQVTVSLGVSSRALGAQEPRELLDQADQALYAAKRTGRNRVVRWDELPDNQQIDPGAIPLPEPPCGTEPETRITFHAVTALVSALAYRSLDVAEHSRRVADLCVAVGRRLLPLSQCYLLEVAALLHDIGKLGVPDAILSKSGSLSDQEWRVIRSHEHMGDEIILAAFTSPELRNTVRNRHCWYGGRPQNPCLPKGQDIPLGARILAIADAFDAMVSDRVYRKGRNHREAFAELRRCAGEQFDPELVERFISIVSAPKESPSTPALFLSKPTALQIGLQVEKLANAVDARDLQSLRRMAERIRANACEHAIDRIAEVAAQLERAAGAGCDWIELTRLTVSLLDLCRSTYVSYLPQPVGADRPGVKPHMNSTAADSSEDKPVCLVS
jgi:diguanylate cyclase (GGDEF)-like protein